jgi:response regulator RpfG family c-di-GMP phosphodiesterase
MTDILVISNNFSSRIAYTAALSGYGYSVSEAQSIHDGQKLLHDGLNPRAVIVDVKYAPSLRDAYNEFAALYAPHERPMLVVIGAVENAQFAEEIADVFLPRPVELYDLIDRVHKSIA